MEKKDSKIIFSEVLRGYTVVESPSYKKISIKHFNNFDSAALDIKNKTFYSSAIFIVFLALLFQGAVADALCIKDKIFTNNLIVHKNQKILSLHYGRKLPLSLILETIHDKE